MSAGDPPRMSCSCHMQSPRLSYRPDPDRPSAYRQPEDTKTAILESLRLNGCQSSKALAASVGYRGINNTFRRCLAELMEDGKIEYLFPGTPMDKRQKICLSKTH